MYKPPSLCRCCSRTNKHKQCCPGIHCHFVDPEDDDDVSAPGIQFPSDDNDIDNIVIDSGESFTIHQPTLIPLNQTTEGLPDSMYLTILEDDIHGDFFFDTLEKIDSNLDVINTIDVGDYIFSFEDSSNPYSFSYEGSTTQHKECIYCTTIGAKCKVFVTESEDDGTLPHDHAY